jgi:hypothetical protein
METWLLLNDWRQQEIMKTRRSAGHVPRFGIFMAVIFQVEVFRVATPCSVVVRYQCFEGPCSLHLHSVTSRKTQTWTYIFIATKTSRLPLGTCFHLKCYQSMTMITEVMINWEIPENKGEGLIFSHICFLYFTETTEYLRRNLAIGLKVNFGPPSLLSSGYQGLFPWG